MLALRPHSPSYRIMNAVYGDLTDWDGEWFHHFNLPSYAFIEWLELKARSPAQHEELRGFLRRLRRLPGPRNRAWFSYCWLPPSGNTDGLYSVAARQHRASNDVRPCFAQQQMRVPIARRWRDE